MASQSHRVLTEKSGHTNISSENIEACFLTELPSISRGPYSGPEHIHHQRRTGRSVRLRHGRHQLGRHLHRYVTVSSSVKVCPSTYMYLFMPMAVCDPAFSITVWCVLDCRSVVTAPDDLRGGRVIGVSEHKQAAPLPPGSAAGGVVSGRVPGASEG